MNKTTVQAIGVAVALVGALVTLPVLLKVILIVAGVYAVVRPQDIAR